MPADLTPEKALDETVVPQSLVTQYAERVARRTWVRHLVGGKWFAEVAGLQGLWGVGDSQAEAEADLAASLQGWCEVRLTHGLGLPVIDGVDPNPQRATALTPSAVPGAGEVERACAAFYNDANGIAQWHVLAANDPALADEYRTRIRAAITALRDGEVGGE